MYKFVKNKKQNVFIQVHISAVIRFGKWIYHVFLTCLQLPGEAILRVLGRLVEGLLSIVCLYIIHKNAETCRFVETLSLM